MADNPARATAPHKENIHQAIIHSPIRLPSLRFSQRLLNKSKLQANTELHDAFRTQSRREFAERSAQAVDVIATLGCWNAEVGMVEEIEGFPSEAQSAVFIKSNVLRHREIYIP